MGDLLDGIKNVSLVKHTKKEEQFIWTSELVDKWFSDYQNGIDNGWGNPYESGEIGYRKGNLQFQYTEAEIDEIKKCHADINYFADKYCFAMTDEGIAKIDLYQFQRNILKSFQKNRYNILLASRQIGKCVVGDTLVNTKNGKISISEIYFSELKKLRKLTIYEKIKCILYKLLNQL